MSEERFRPLRGVGRGIFVVFTLFGLLVAIMQVLHLRPFGLLLIENAYLYALMAVYLSITFLVFPIKPGSSNKVLFLLDLFLFLLSLFVCTYFCIHAKDILFGAWSLNAPFFETVLCVIFWFLILEAGRRAGGWSLTVIVSFFSFFLVFASYMPGFLEGLSLPFKQAATYHVLSTQSVIGIPLSVFGKLVIGFIFFGVAIVHTGGGAFFMGLALSLLGGTRGGPAKVAVGASALFGSVSGSAISNVVTIGTLTIPAMKKVGYPAYFAAAVEACASTGGVLMPPVMGATAFVMASFLNLPYLYICVGAAIPSILYYWGILVQVDGHAAKMGMKGLPKSELPPFGRTLLQGWPYLLAIVVLIYFLVLRLESEGPFYAAFFLILIAMVRKQNRFTLRTFLELMETSGKLLCELIAVLAAIGMILGSFAGTGVGQSFSAEIVLLAGGNVPLLLFLAAIASFILGMGMTITACYIFLAIVVAPAVVEAGFNPLAVHLFLMYWGMLSYLTPPVAMAVLPASSIAGAPFMKSGMQAVRLGAVKYIIPFLFITDASLILQGSWMENLSAVIPALFGVTLIGSGIEGYLLGVGLLKTTRFPILGGLARVALVVSGVLMAHVGSYTDLIGLGIALVVIIPLVIKKIIHKRDSSFRTESTVE